MVFTMAVPKNFSTGHKKQLPASIVQMVVHNSFDIKRKNGVIHQIHISKFVYLCCGPIQILHIVIIRYGRSAQGKTVKSSS